MKFGIRNPKKAIKQLQDIIDKVEALPKRSSELMLENWQAMFQGGAQKNMMPNSAKWVERKSNIHSTNPNTVPTNVGIEQNGVFTGTLYNAISAWQEGDKWLFGLSEQHAHDKQPKFIESKKTGVVRGGDDVGSYASRVEWDYNIETSISIPVAPHGFASVEVGSLITWAGLSAIQKLISEIRSTFKHITLGE